jgi:carbonic anhydrase
MPSPILAEVQAANDRFAAGFTKGDLPMPPGRKFAVLACMDARLDPARVLGLEEGDAHVIRNAGGRASPDALRSLIISYKLLGTREFLVVHHTDCGMLTFTNEQIRGMLADDPGADASSIDFLPSATSRPVCARTSRRSARRRSFQATSPSRASSTTSGRGAWRP